MDRVDGFMRRGRPMQKGQVLCQQGDTFQSVYAVRTGALKTYTLASNGEEQITGFHLASELVGLAGYDNEIYPLTAKARSEEHTSELQSRPHLVCRLLLEKKKKRKDTSKK